MTYALIAVDVQRDFLPGGPLGVPDGDTILSPLHDLAIYAELTVATRDWHPSNHFSFSSHPRYEDGSWPPHCVQKSKGAQIHPSVNKYSDYVISKGMNRNPPDAYSAFALGAKTLRPVLSMENILARYPHIRTLVVAGLTLDYCVRYTALDANALGYQTILPLDATMALTEKGRDEAIAELERAGVEVVESYARN